MWAISGPVDMAVIAAVWAVCSWLRLVCSVVEVWWAVVEAGPSQWDGADGGGVGVGGVVGVGGWVVPSRV
ncbi:Uncharacterised protein [Mycobacteroides abscessus subsp. abscessus]|nr:Uncharacterised protein [Mycobacteroides abscessus subsp. abscessus]